LWFFGKTVLYQFYPRDFVFYTTVAVIAGPSITPRVPNPSEYGLSYVQHGFQLMAFGLYIDVFPQSAPLFKVTGNDFFNSIY
jgi:hypothetical protein